MALADAVTDVLVVAQLLLIVIFALWCERFSLGKKLSAAVVALIIGAICSNTGLLPQTSRVYGVIVSYLVPLAVALLLFKANLQQVVAGAGRLVVAFLICVAGTCLGGIVGLLLLPLGPEADKLLGVFIATYTGGSVNFVAVAQTLALTDAGLLAAALASDAIAGTAYLIFLAVMATSTWFIRAFPVHPDCVTLLSRPARSQETDRPTTRLPVGSVALALLLAAGVCWCSALVAQYFSVPRFTLLFITLFAVALANILPRQLGGLRGDFEIGMFLMYLFFVVVGAGADISILFSFGSVLIIYAFLICLIHASVVIAAGKLFRFNYAELITASNACILGPAPAAALAAHHKWHSLVTPGLLCGILGYVIANFIGASLSLWVGG